MTWARISRALAAFSLDPLALGGLWLRRRASPVRDLVLAGLDGAQPLPQRRLHPQIGDEALFGGMDLALTLQAGRAVRRPGILEHAAVLILPMAERAEPGLAARLSQAIDAGRHALIALDESAEADEALPPGLADRLGLFLDLSDLRAPEAPDLSPDGAIPDLVAASTALGCPELRGVLATLALARSLAALDGQTTLTPAHLEEAATFSLSHRAAPQAEAAPPPQTPPPRHAA